MLFYKKYCEFIIFLIRLKKFSVVFFFISFLKSTFFQNFDLKSLITFLIFEKKLPIMAKYDIRTILHFLYDLDFKSKFLSPPLSKISLVDVIFVK